MTKRAKYIKANYKLEYRDGEWVATGPGTGPDGYGEISGNRAEVVRLARRHWGHFNYQDETEAFNEIFRDTQLTQTVWSDPAKAAQGLFPRYQPSWKREVLGIDAPNSGIQLPDIDPDDSAEKP